VTNTLRPQPWEERDTPQQFVVRPKRIVAAFVLLVAELAVGGTANVANLISAFGGLAQEAREHAVGLSESSAQATFLIAFVAACTFLAIYQALLIVLLVFIFRGHGWARILQTIVLAIVGALDAVQLLLGRDQLIICFGVAGAAAVLVLLWGGSAGRYFAARRAVAVEARAKAMAPTWRPPQ
jgi:hypothetical protein